MTPGDKVTEVMTRDVAELPASNTVIDAAKLMADRNVGSVVVLNEKGEACGIVTDRDIVVKALARGDGADMALDAICSDSLVCVTPDAKLSDAVETMREKEIRRLPVIQNGHVVGILSLGDLAVARDPESVLGEMSAQPPNN